MTTEIQVTKEQVENTLTEIEDHAQYVDTVTSITPTTTDTRFNTFTESITAANKQLLSRINDINQSAKSFAQDIFILDETEKFITPVDEYIGGVTSAVSTAGSSVVSDSLGNIHATGESITNGIRDLLGTIGTNVDAFFSQSDDNIKQGIDNVQALIASLFDGSLANSISFPEVPAGLDEEGIDSIANAAKAVLAAVDTLSATTNEVLSQAPATATVDAGSGEIVIDKYADLTKFEGTPPFDPGQEGTFYVDSSDTLVYETPEKELIAISDYDSGEPSLAEYSGNASGETQLSSADSSHTYTSESASSSTGVSSTGVAGDNNGVSTHLSDADTSKRFTGTSEIRPAYLGTETGGVTLTKDELAAVIEQAIASEALGTSVGSDTSSYGSLSGVSYSDNAQFYVDDMGNYYIYEPGSSGGLADFGSLAGTTSYGDSGLTIGSPISESMIDVSQVNYDRPANGALSQDQVYATIGGALDAVGIADPAARERWAGVVEYMMQHESGNDPAAGNDWDSNAIGARQVDGLPGQASRGLMQTIPTTFAAHHVSGTSNSIYDPVANTAAAINYMMVRYGIDAYGNGLDAFYGRRFPTYMGY